MSLVLLDMAQGAGLISARASLTASSGIRLRSALLFRHAGGAVIVATIVVARDNLATSIAHAKLKGPSLGPNLNPTSLGSNCVPPTQNVVLRWLGGSTSS